MKTKRVIIKALVMASIFAISSKISAQTITQVQNLNLTRDDSISLVQTAKHTLAEEIPNLSKYIDESQTPTITKHIIHITAEKKRLLSSYNRFFGADDGSVFYKVELPCSMKIFREERFAYPYVAIIYIWEETYRPFAMNNGISGIKSRIY